mmetsp:Transcript_26937/g.69686  ORF Transcript_26937/g.69686 Transcript_26937/m.69686 type:complete len:515 (-) Transcript_26937:32-1576(-)
MDEEDMQEHFQAGSTIVSRQQDGDPETAQRKPEGEVASVLVDLVEAAGSIGEKIFAQQERTERARRAIARRDAGHFIFTPTTPRRVMGAELPPHLKRQREEKEAAEDVTSAAAANRHRDFQLGLRLLKVPKTDFKGIGSRDGILRSQQRSMTGLPMDLSKATKESDDLYGAFGTGVLDQEDECEWENIYGDTTQYDSSVATTVSKEKEARKPLALGGGEYPGYILSTVEEVKGQRYPPPLVPPSFTGVRQYHPEEAVTETHEKLLAWMKERGIALDPSSRAKLLGEQPARPTAQQREALWAEVADDTKKKMLSMLGCKSFVRADQQDMCGSREELVNRPFAMDPKKQKRYERFCMSIEGKLDADKAYEDVDGIGEQQVKAEIAEFGRVYKLFREEHPTATAVQSAPTQTGTRRFVCNWKPEPVLCKRFGVPDPWKHRQFFDDSANKMGKKKSFNERFASMSDRVTRKSAAFDAGVVAALSVGERETKAAEPAPEPEEEVRPPSELFKSIFDTED